ncbi:unnamed protein product [Blepharisma stoltei]|uniref:Uncharacterized protein n=1 Tax=Blepharisma stoltei TaxID=1481888 RepID=A0AAU9J827_9CILI|nr:unnamed protein product [Blepharisma stoltei]
MKTSRSSSKPSPLTTIPDFLQKLSQARLSLSTIKVPQEHTFRDNQNKSTSHQYLKKHESKLPYISIHRNPMSLFTERELRNDIRKRPKKFTHTKAHHWAVNKYITYGIPDWDKEYKYLKDAEKRFIFRDPHKSIL